MEADTQENVVFLFLRFGLLLSLYTMCEILVCPSKCTDGPRYHSNTQNLPSPFWIGKRQWYNGKAAKATILSIHRPLSRLHPK